MDYGFPGSRDTCQMIIIDFINYTFYLENLVLNAKFIRYI